MATLVAAVAVAYAGPAAADSIFDTEAGHAVFAEVLRAAAFGIIGGERAAFIIEAEDGTLRCELWPTTSQVHEERFHGAIPLGTVAIVHTHPPEWPLPSAQDRQEASRLDMPIYVLTLTDVYKVTPRSSRPDEIVRGHLWISRQQSPPHCQLIHRSEERRGESAVDSPAR